MEPETNGVSRRTMLGAGAGVPVATLLLAACGEASTTGTCDAGGYGAPASVGVAQPRYIAEKMMTTTEMTGSVPGIALKRSPQV